MTAYIFDTECTDKDDPEIIEAAWLRFAVDSDLAGDAADRIPKDCAVDDVFCQRYKSSKPMRFGALAVHHILPSELEDCEPSSAFALPYDATYLIGHNIDFDWRAIGAPPAVKRIDTCAISRWLWPDCDAHSLVALIYYTLGATADTRQTVKNAHGAKHDCYSTQDLLAQILKAKPEITTWSALHAYSEECRLPRTCRFKRYEGVLLSELPIDFVGWVLRQDWIDDYERKAYQRVYNEFYAPRLKPAVAATPETVEEDDGIPF